MDDKDIKEVKEEIAQNTKDEKEMLESQEAIQEEMQEEIRNFAETSPEMGPNGFWNQSGTFWVLGIAGILIIFLVIWVCFFYGPNN